MYRRKFLAQVTVNAAILFLPARKCSEKGKHLPISRASIVKSAKTPATGS
jgi:hypothetical protein